MNPIEARPRASQWFAILAGLFLLDVGVLSLVTDGLSFADASHSASFVIWKASGWNTIGRIAIGGLGLAACWRLSAARSYCILAAVAFGILAIWGFADDGIETMGVFAFGTPGNVTHAVLALTAAAVALTTAPTAHRDAGATPSPASRGRVQPRLALAETDTLAEESLPPRTP
jgi:hypothetical protein